MSKSEVAEGRAGGVERERGGRAAAVVAWITTLCMCALVVAGFVLVSRAQDRRRQSRLESAQKDAAARAGSTSDSGEAMASSPALNEGPDSWSIRGALSETCTCSVPCTCNFGDGPSPHDYCYPFYSYDIRQGNYGATKLDGLRFGAADMKSGRTIFIDERADERQREALRLIAMRVIEHVAATEAAKKASELASHIRYAAIEQEYDDRHNHLSVAGIGEFSADYIMGLDGSQPLVVRNNTTWRIRDAIKARTSIYRVRLGRDVIDTRRTNSNQGEFDYTDRTDFGGPAGWNCAASMSGNDDDHAAPAGQDASAHSCN